MELSKENKEMLKSAFAHHPSVEVFFVTADNQAFDEAGRADSHAQRLKSEKVLTVARDSFEAGEAPLETERAQAAHTVVNAVDTIPMEIINLDKSGTNDAGATLEKERKETKEVLENAEDVPGEKTAEEIEKAEQALAAAKSVDELGNKAIAETSKAPAVKPVAKPKADKNKS